MNFTLLFIRNVLLDDPEIYFGKRLNIALLWVLRSGGEEAAASNDGWAAPPELPAAPRPSTPSYTLPSGFDGERKFWIKAIASPSINSDKVCESVLPSSAASARSSSSLVVTMFSIQSAALSPRHPARSRSPRQKSCIAQKTPSLAHPADAHLDEEGGFRVAPPLGPPFTPV